MAATATAKTGHIVQVNPADLTVSDNVREDTSVDDAFVNSIKENGVLQPPMVTPNDAGGYEIVFGHRRTLGAIQAGLATIDAYVVDRAEAAAARIVDQLAENQQRKQLTRAEELGGYKQLALIGLSPAQIAKRTATNRKTVDTALAVADNATATKALTNHDITLDQAAVIVDFSDDRAAVKQLTDRAETDPTRFDHLVAELTKTREHKQLKATLKTELEELVAEGRVIALDEADYDMSAPSDTNAKRLSNWAKADTPTVELTAADIVGTPAAAARLVAGNFYLDGSWGRHVTIQYFVLDPEGNDFVPLQREIAQSEPRELTPEEIAANERREEQRRAEGERREAITTARGVRIAWLKDFLQRTKFPTDVDLYMVRSTLDVGSFFEWELDDDVLQLAGMPVPTPDEKLATEEHINVTAAKSALDTNPKLATRIMLALIFHSVERLTGDGNFYEGYMAKALLVHFTQLEAWGYGLSEMETSIRESAIAYLAPTPDSEDGEADEDEAGK